MDTPKYLDTSLSFPARAEDLVARMTTEEAAGQLRYDALPIERLGVKRYNWWNEALHGVARCGMATVFPQAIGLAATFDEDLLQKMGAVIAEEGRAKFNQFQAEKDYGIYKGITYWSPNINIFRDPRWGRGQETYGEDPYLTARLGVGFVRGVQGDNPKYLKAAACAKHFAVHSGPEANRHEFDAIAGAKDMEQTYLPAFEALAKEAKVAGFMGAYNRTNGEPCCASKALMDDILYEKWGFDGYYASDCWALADFHMFHKITDTPTESAALALHRGCHLNCGITYLHLLQALEEGLVTEAEIRQAAVKVMTIRMRLGMFDPQTPWDDTPYDVVCSPAHRQFNLDVARRSLVLLQNSGLLPLDGKALKRVAVIGPNADSQVVLHGNYHGTDDEYTTVLEGMRKALPGVHVTYSRGCHLYQEELEGPGYFGDGFSEAVTHAKRADVVVLCLGLDESIEGEEMKGSEWTGDKKDLLLPKIQRGLLKAVLDAGTPVILVNFSGSAIDWEAEGLRADAILQAFYPGGAGGDAIADVLLGNFNPCGRLPVTFYHNDDPLPDYEDYSMQGRTYKYLETAPLFPFGFGLSYTRFAYSNLEATDNPLAFRVTVANTGNASGEEIMQAYVAHPDASEPQGRWQLAGMRRVALAPGAQERITLHLPESLLATVRADGSRVQEGGHYILYVGGSQPDDRSLALGAAQPVSLSFSL